MPRLLPIDTLIGQADPAYPPMVQSFPWIGDQHYCNECMGYGKYVSWTTLN